MRGSIRTLLPLLLIPLTLFCWFRAYHLHRKATSSLFVTKSEKQIQDVLHTSPLTSTDPVLQRFDNITIGDSRDNLFYFMQVNHNLFLLKLRLTIEKVTKIGSFFLLRFQTCIYQNFRKLAVLYISYISL